MANSDLIMTLGKVIIAAAWADGEISNEEVNSLKDLLFNLPELNARQWAELDMYIDYPITARERDRLIEELRLMISSEKERKLATQAMNAMVNADGKISEEEQQVVAQIRDAIANAETGLIASLSKLVKGSVSRRSEEVRHAPNREKYFEDYLNNRVYFDVRRRLDLGEAEIDLPDRQLRKLAMAGGLMGQVALTDKTVTDDELQVIMAALQKDWDLDTDQAAFMAGIAVQETTSQIDRFRLAREFVEVCTREELEGFAKILFDIAAADGMVSRDEIEEIRLISRSLLLSHEQYINAKLSIPKEKRAE